MMSEKKGKEEAKSTIFFFFYFMECSHTKILLNQLFCERLLVFVGIFFFLLTGDQRTNKLPLTSARSNASAHSALSFGGDDPSTWSDNEDSLFSSARGVPKKVNLAKLAGVNIYWYIVSVLGTEP